VLRPWKISLAERVDRRRSVPVYQQIVQALIHDIQRGRLVPGTFLPSSRELATTLGVNRKTIVIAYDDLIAQGWLASDGTRGTIVSSSLPELAPRPVPILQPDTGSESTAPEFKIRPAADPLPAFVESTQLTFDDGAPDARLLSPDVLSRAYRTALRQAVRGNWLGYGDPRGSPILRETIANMLMTHRGLVASADNICITRGSQMAIFLAARILLRPGETVLVEALSYAPAWQAFRAAGAAVVGAKLDDNGLDVADVERLCRKHKVRALYLTPHHQFPTTVSLTPQRRLRLLDLASQFGFAIIEDDYDHEFHFEQQPLLPMASYAPRRTVYIGSMSKLLLPGLRIGYVAAAPDVIRLMPSRSSWRKISLTSSISKCPTAAWHSGSHSATLRFSTRSRRACRTAMSASCPPGHSRSRPSTSADFASAMQASRPRKRRKPCGGSANWPTAPCGRRPRSGVNAIDDANSRSQTAITNGKPAPFTRPPTNDVASTRKQFRKWRRRSRVRSLRLCRSR
jgi:GntR family transcriptional regulator/MocR family aminotransferase